jgi:hypothetical protein
MKEKTRLLTVNVFVVGFITISWSLKEHRAQESPTVPYSGTPSIQRVILLQYKFDI